MLGKSQRPQHAALQSKARIVLARDSFNRHTSDSLFSKSSSFAGQHYALRAHERYEQARMVLRMPPRSLSVHGVFKSAASARQCELYESSEKASEGFRFVCIGFWRLVFFRLEITWAADSKAPGNGCESYPVSAWIVGPVLTFQGSGIRRSRAMQTTMRP